MRKLIIIAILATSLMGCESSMDRAKTRRYNATTNQMIEDSQATAGARQTAKIVTWYVFMIAGAVVAISGAGALSWLMIGASINRVRFYRVPLDIQTRQYPLLVYGNGRRIFNPNTGERLLLSENSGAQLERIEAQTRVQLAGLLPGRLIDSEVR